MWHINNNRFASWTRVSNVCKSMLSIKIKKKFECIISKLNNNCKVNRKQQCKNKYKTHSKEEEIKHISHYPKSEEFELFN